MTFPSFPTARSRLRALFAAGVALAWLTLAGAAGAAPEAKLLRVDPRAAQDNGSPVLTTVIELVQSKRVSEAVSSCAALRQNAQLDCMAAALEKPFALYTPFPFPEKNAIFTVSVDGTDVPAKYVSHNRWGESLEQPGVGTAWLILIDADSRMGSAFDDARATAAQFVASLSSNDIVNVMFFDDRQVVKDSKWLSAAQKSQAKAFVDSVGSTFQNRGRNRSLLTIIKQAATDGFKALGNVGETVKVPLHQAMVVLSSGFGGTDPSTTGPGALQLQSYLTQGRFPEDNTALPKSPVPVISVYYPPRVIDEFRQNSLEFMQNLANSEIGGFFTVMQDGQSGRASGIVNAIRTRFSKMYIVKWRVSCVAPSVTQSFKLVFNNVNPPVLGDNTFKDVPVGINPTTWPLDVNQQYTQDMVRRQDGVYPGGTFKVYGDFCWGGNKNRAEVYFLPAGQQAPAALGGADIEQAKRAQQQLVAMDMKGEALEASDTYVEFKAPDNDKILAGSGEQAIVRLVLYDNGARRASGVTEASIVKLKGSERPFPILWVLGGLFGLVVIALLGVVTVRSGGRKRRATPPPAPVIAAGPPQAYGAPGYGYGPPPQPAPAAPQPAAAPTPAAAPPAVNHEFMYGSPGGYSPPNALGGPATVTRATLQGAAGVFTVVPGVQMRAGRDGNQCAILLSEGRVSAVHATVQIENGSLLVRDENSNNGTTLNGNRLAPATWTVVPNGSLLRFGPVEFSVRLE